MIIILDILIFLLVYAILLSQTVCSAKNGRIKAIRTAHVVSKGMLPSFLGYCKR